MKQLLIGACALTLLAACGQRGAETSATPADGSAPAPAADAGASAKRVAGYKSRLIPLVAGSYGGNCMTMAAPAPKEGVSISSAGLASAQGWKGDLMGATDLFILSRTVQGATPVSASLMVTATEPAWTLALDSNANGSATFGAGDTATMCHEVPQVAALRAKSLYPVLASFFIAGNTSLLCVEALSKRELAVAAGPAGVSVGGRAFSFERGLTSEMAAVDGNGKTLTYKVDYEGGDKLSISVDDSGKISELIAVGKGDANYTCVTKQG
jgi:hypothetical protein